MNNLQVEAQFYLRRLKKFGFKNKGIVLTTESGISFDAVQLFDIKGNFVGGFHTESELKGFYDAIFFIANYEREVNHSHIYVDNMYNPKHPYGHPEEFRNAEKERRAKRKQEILNRKKTA